MENLSIFSLKDLQIMYYRMLALYEDDFYHISENCPTEIIDAIKSELSKVEILIDKY
jgi:ubiquinone biosynthesis protein Coq4